MNFFSKRNAAISLSSSLETNFDEELKFGVSRMIRKLVGDQNNNDSKIFAGTWVEI